MSVPPLAPRDQLTSHSLTSHHKAPACLLTNALACKPTNLQVCARQAPCHPRLARGPRHNAAAGDAPPLCTTATCLGLCLPVPHLTSPHLDSPCLTLPDRRCATVAWRCSLRRSNISPASPLGAHRRRAPCLRTARARTMHARRMHLNARCMRTACTLHTRKHAVCARTLRPAAAGGHVPVGRAGEPARASGATQRNGAPPVDTYSCGGCIPMVGTSARPSRSTTSIHVHNTFTVWLSAHAGAPRRGCGAWRELCGRAAAGRPPSPAAELRHRRVRVRRRAGQGVRKKVGSSRARA